MAMQNLLKKYTKVLLENLSFQHSGFQSDLSVVYRTAK